MPFADDAFYGYGPVAEGDTGPPPVVALRWLFIAIWTDAVTVIVRGYGYIAVMHSGPVAVGRFRFPYGYAYTVTTRYCTCTFD